MPQIYTNMELDEQKLLEMIKSENKELICLAMTILVGLGLDKLIRFIEKNGVYRTAEATSDVILLSRKVIKFTGRSGNIDRFYIRFLPKGSNEPHYIFCGEWISVFKGYNSMNKSRVIDLSFENIVDITE